MNTPDEFDSLIDRFSESLGIDSSEGKAEWIPYHGYLDIMDSLFIDIQVSGYFWILEKSTKFTKIWHYFL